MEILRMVGIGKSFGGDPVLENVARDLRSGEVHVLAGETVPKEITLSSRVFTKENFDAGGEWLKKALIRTRPDAKMLNDRRGRRRG